MHLLQCTLIHFFFNLSFIAPTSHEHVTSNIPLRFFVGLSFGWDDGVYSNSERAQIIFCPLRAVVCYPVTLLLFAHAHTRCCNRRCLKGIMHKIKAIFCPLELIYGRRPTHCCGSESGSPGQQDSFIIYWASESHFSLAGLV